MNLNWLILNPSSCSLVSFTVSVARFELGLKKTGAIIIIFFIRQSSINTNICEVELTFCFNRRVSVNIIRVRVSIRGGRWTPIQ